MHPDDAGAEEYYESIYGRIFARYPQAKGLILVGESIEFPSRDPHTTGKIRSIPGTEAAEWEFPDKRPSPGWWPCSDYPQYIGLLKRVVRRHCPQADIVFWTYNWGWAPEEARVALLRALPEDITVMVTFEMFEKLRHEGITNVTVDYTLSFEGPGKYFTSEAETVHARGMRLYTMSNAAGLTWDFGVIPYEPAPFQWALRPLRDGGRAPLRLVAVGDLRDGQVVAVGAGDSDGGACGTDGAQRLRRGCRAVRPRLLAQMERGNDLLHPDGRGSVRPVPHRPATSPFRHANRN